MNVDWTLLLGIVGVIFYVIVPLFAGNKKKGQQQQRTEQPKQQAPQRPPSGQQQASPQARPQTAQRQAQAGAGKPTPPAAPRNLREVIEQIQQQVREAEQEWQAAQQQQAEPKPKPAPAARPAPTPVALPEEAPRSTTLISSPERRLSDLGSGGPIRPKARRASVRTFEDTNDEEIEVREAFVQVTPESVLHGLIWHEILSEPKGLRGTRRSRLPLR